MLHQKIDEGSLCEGSIPDMLRDIAILLQGIKESLADMLLITFLHQLSTLFFSIAQYIQLTQQYGKEILHMLCKPMIYNLIEIRKGKCFTENADILVKNSFPEAFHNGKQQVGL